MSNDEHHGIGHEIEKAVGIVLFAVAIVALLPGWIIIQIISKIF